MNSLKIPLQDHITSLPPLPESVLEIERICRNPDSGINDLVTVVEQDPLLTANLLRTANSAYFGFANKVTSIDQAISLFGMSMVWGFAIEAATRQSFNIDLNPYGITVEQFANISRAESALMWNWLSRQAPELTSTLIPTSFVSRIGMVVIAAQIEEHGLAQKFFNEIKETKGDINTIERKYIGNSNQEVCGAIFAHWNFDKTMVSAIWSCEFPERADNFIKPFAYALKTAHTLIPYNGKLTDQSKKDAFSWASNLISNDTHLSKAIDKLL